MATVAGANVDMPRGPWARGNAGANSTPLCERVALESKALAANISAGINRDFSLEINSRGFLSRDCTRCIGNEERWEYMIKISFPRLRHSAVDVCTWKT